MNRSVAHTGIKEASKMESEQVVVLHHPLQAVPFSLQRSFSLQKKRWRFIKRAVDLLLSTILLICLFSWICPLLALIIRFDSPGPVFFIQKRNKRKGRVFYCIKFRTMFVNRDADHQPSRENDPRITRVGRFLRYSHLDELPQLLNVLSGDMSIIGPRPYMISDNQRYQHAIPSYSLRHDVKPGITGHAQVHGHVGQIKGVQHMQERLKKDIYYIENWSPAFDVRILWLTIIQILQIRK